MAYDDIIYKYAELLAKKAEKTSKEILEENPRVDSRSAKEIEKLYNVKSDGLEYERNIMEVAHPNPVIVAPAHDKINGLVENEMERQNITINLLNKKPRFPNVFHQKYANAKKELALSLVRTANFLDAKEEQELTQLADVCIAQLAKKKDNNDITKKAAAPLVIAAVAVPAAILAGIAVIQNMNMKDLGFERNLKRLKSELNDLVNKTGGWGTSSLKKEFIQSMKDVQAHLDSLLAVYKKFEAIIYNVQKPKDFNELIQQAKEDAGKLNEVKKAFAEISVDLTQTFAMLNQIENTFKSETYKAEQVEDYGILSQIGDVLNIGGLIHGDNALISDDFNDVLRAIPPFKQSALDIKKVLIEASKEGNSAKKQLEQVKSEVGDMTIPTEMLSETPSATSDQKPQSKEDEEVESLFKQFK